MCKRSNRNSASNIVSTQGDIIDVTVAIFANCDFVKFKPNISVFINNGCTWNYAGQVEYGQITFYGLEKGKGYSFGAWIEDYWFDEFIAVYNAYYEINVDLPPEVCNYYSKSSY